MAEFSMWWTTGGAGDGSATYTRSDHAMWAKVLASCNGLEGVAPNYLNKLAGTVTALNTVSINTGGALVDGKIYNNSSAVSVNIPSAVGGGNTRIDRIVARADWTAQTVRITRIAGTDAAVPTAPAKSSSSGTLYDILLYQALVDTAGTVILTDERTMAQAQTVDLADLAVSEAKIAALAVTSGKLGAGAVIAGKIGANAINSTGLFSYGAIEAAAIKDGEIIAGKIGTGGVSAAAQIANDVIDSQHYVDGSIDTVHIGDSQVTAAKIANDSVDDTKVGDRVAQVYRRQGGDATAWDDYGLTNYTPAAVRIQVGQIYELDSSATVTFPVAFSASPLVFVTSRGPSGGIIFDVFSVSATAFGVTGMNHDGSFPTSMLFSWLAIGPE